MKKVLSVVLSAIMLLCILPMTEIASFAETSGNYEYDVLSSKDKTCYLKKYNGSASSVTIPSTINGYKVTEIGSAFSENTNLKSVIIPNTVTRLSNSFYNCTSLSSVTIPSSVKELSSYTFGYCSSLYNISIPDSVTYISGSAFYNSGIFKTESNWSNGVLYIGNNLIYTDEYSVGTSYTVRPGTRLIANSAFSWCEYLESINIPDSVLYINSYAFNRCTSLNSVTLPPNLKEIESGMFYNCKSLTNVTIPSNVKAIGYGAFYSCDALASLTVPSNVTLLDYNAIYDCPNLRSVIILGNSVKFGNKAVGYDYNNDTAKDEILDNFTLYGYSSGTAKGYASKNGLKFVDIGNKNLMNRLYNPNSGEHFYTADENEKNWLASLGWKFEGIGWLAPKSSSTPVYRLYNKGAGEHHYTTDVNEKNHLVSLGWTNEGTGWYSATASGVPLYRQYNPNAFANNHNYTTDKGENDWLVGLGWRYEGIGWYGLSA